MSCAEQQLVMNPEPTKIPETSPSAASLMKSSGSLLEGAEIKQENGKTIIKPKKKIRLKELMAFMPYELKIDNSVVRPMSPPCDYNWITYAAMTKFGPKTNNTLGFMIENGYIL